MPWVKFVKDYDQPLGPSALRAYKTGMVELVSQETADAAFKAKAVERAEKPGKKFETNAGR